MKTKKLLKIECASKAFVKMLAVTDRNAESSGAAAQPQVTEARLALSCGLTYFPNRSVLLPRLFRTCMFMESKCAYSPYLVGWLRNFTLKRGTVVRGRGGLGAQHSWAFVFTVQPVLQLEFRNFGNMFLKSLSTYNLYIKKKKNLFDGRLGPLNQYSLSSRTLLN